MIKLNKFSYIEESDVEIFCDYSSSKPLQFLVKDKKESNMIRELKGRYGYKTLIIQDDGYVYLAPYEPITYTKRCKPDEFCMMSPSCYIRINAIREITTKLNSFHHRDIKTARASKMFINLTKGKSATHYVFMKTGRIYALHIRGDLFFEKTG